MPDHIGAHPNDAPSFVNQLCGAFDVPSALLCARPMLRAVELDAYLVVRPSHVEASDKVAETIPDDELCLWGGKSRAHNNEPRTCFPR
ncbi:Uncharacterised protein [Mycobacteroides abscessus subsp. abscessus]|nr:Uncharacterised protein [Mycobacteroides abscessus subsp. abscessus]